MPTLRIQRERGLVDKMRKYRIFVDGVEVGRLSEGEAIEQTVASGEHSVQAKIDWCGSPSIVVDVREGTRIVRVQTGMRGWRILIAAFYVTFSRNRYLAIEADALPGC